MSRPVFAAQFGFRDRPVERGVTPNKKLAVWRDSPDSLYSRRSNQSELETRSRPHRHSTLASRGAAWP